MNRKQRRARAHEYKDALELMKKRKKRQEKMEEDAKKLEEYLSHPVGEEYLKARNAMLKEYAETHNIKIEEQKPSAFVDPVWQMSFGEKLKKLTEKKTFPIQTPDDISSEAVTFINRSGRLPGPITEQEFWDAVNHYQKEGQQ